MVGYTINDTVSLFYAIPNAELKFEARYFHFYHTLDAFWSALSPFKWRVRKNLSSFCSYQTSPYGSFWLCYCLLQVHSFIAEKVSLRFFTHTRMDPMIAV